ncbi:MULTISPECIES: glycosyltransferase family 2 protein [Citrobacter]|uniref:glycosyltransferase family 2 protein n=1 Tax=Citrobacter TaxID=544 RepID=UPI002578D7FA|nr:glycosyltransferase family 2 protein [Citrobacter sp. Cu231]MDM2744847.1 glycosyltransferase family 2 protein [Citrobacter sp. Cu231]
MKVNITIIVPTYKRFDSLKKLVNSLNEQTDTSFKLIVVNDDPDKSIKLKDFTQSKFDVSIINNSNNIGAASSRNKGAQLADTEWICFLDDDDEFRNDKISVLRTKICSNPNAEVIINAALINLKDENISYKTMPNPDNYKKNISMFNSLGGAPLLTIKRDFFIDIGMYDPALEALEDYDLNIRIIKAHSKILFISDELTICNYTSTANTVSKVVANNINATRKIIKKYPDVFAYNKDKVFSWIYSTLAYKSLLTKSRFTAIKLYLLSLNFNFNLKVFISLFIVLFSPRILFWMRSKQK